MNEEANNVNNIKRLQEKALLWRMWIIGLSFVIPAISIGTSMAFSVVGKDFYMQHRNFDGSDVVSKDTILHVANDNETTQNSSSPDSANTDVYVAFTQDEISWFGNKSSSFKELKACNV